MPLVRETHACRSRHGTPGVAWSPSSAHCSAKSRLRSTSPRGHATLPVHLALPVGQLRLQVRLRDHRAVNIHGGEPRVAEQDRLQLLDHLFRSAVSSSSIPRPQTEGRSNRERRHAHSVSPCVALAKQGPPKKKPAGSSCTIRRASASSPKASRWPSGFPGLFRVVSSSAPASADASALTGNLLALSTGARRGASEPWLAGGNGYASRPGGADCGWIVRRVARLPTTKLTCRGGW